MIGRIDEYIKMSQVEEHHWWYKCLHNLVLNAIRNNFKKKDIVIIDAGCGTGGNIKHLTRNGYTNLSGLDISPHAVKICQKQNIPVRIGDIKYIDTFYKLKSAQVIICNDVFYFLTEDERARTLNSFHKILTNNGIVILNLPALEIFKGTHDLAVGINKRFSKKTIDQSIDINLFSFAKRCFWPFLLSPVILAVRLLQRIKLAFNNKSEIKSDVTMPAPFFNSFFYKLISLENKFLPWKPFGSSLFVVLKKK